MTETTASVRPTIYLSAHYPDRKSQPIHLNVVPCEGGFAVTHARGGPPLSGGATVAEAVEKGLAEARKQQEAT